MIEATIGALTAILQPWPLFLMLCGVFCGSIFAALPGIGSLVLIALVLPYAVTLDPYGAIALLLGIGAVANTANTFPSVLISVPGSAGSQATIVDGFPMAQKGEAKRAFGAAFAASAIGGVFGAAALFLSLPVLSPLVLSFGSPEFLMLVVWGLSAVGVLSGKAPVKGFIAALLGVLIASVGVDDKTGIERFNFGGLYLLDGVSIVIVGLGLFAVPEMIALAVRRSRISETAELGAGLFEGIKDVFRNWWLVIRCSLIGVWVGFLPGLGSSVADWFAYAHAKQTEKNPENFGAGDVRGVIAPESSNNAKEGGALIPTIAFGIPGSASLALILVAFISVGILPGAAMLTDQLPYTMAMVWVLVLANILSALLALAASGVFARVCLLPFYIVVPMTLVLCLSSSFTAHLVWADIAAFFVFALTGYFMKQYGWPRPPLLVALVLGGQLERYLWLSQARYGASWLLEPTVLAIIALILLTVAVPIWRARKNREKREEKTVSMPRASIIGDLWFSLGVALVFIVASVIALQWPLRSNLIVLTVAGLGLPLLALQARAHFKVLRTAAFGMGVEAEGGLDGATVKQRTREIFLWLFGLGAGVYLFGFYVAVPVFILSYVRRYGGSWLAAALLSALGVGIIYVIFELLLNVFWPASPILDLVLSL
jgi:putative tricarboxylic transport membrane protein